jgi:hypothetical protein
MCPFYPIFDGNMYGNLWKDPRFRFKTWRSRHPNNSQLRKNSEEVVKLLVAESVVAGGVCLLWFLSQTIPHITLVYSIRRLRSIAGTAKNGG